MTDELPAVPNRWAPLLPSLVAAAAVFAWGIVSSIALTVLGALPSPPFAPHLERILDLSTLVYVALSVALLFSFWLAAPINGGLTVRTVVVRVLIAAGIAVVVMFPVEFVVYSARFAELTAQNSGPVQGLYEVQPEYGPVEALGWAAVEAVQIAIARLPLIALAAFGSWAWQRRSIRAQEA